MVYVLKKTPPYIFVMEITQYRYEKYFVQKT